jgi:hypothetical protein
MGRRRRGVYAGWWPEGPVSRYFRPVGQQCFPSEVQSSKSSERLQVASAVQASGFRGDVTAAERVYTIEAAHNPEVAGSNPAAAT